MKPSDWLESRLMQLTEGNVMAPSRARWQAIQEWLDQDKADQGGKSDQHFAEVGDAQTYAPSAACICGHRYDEHALDWQSCEKCPCKGFRYLTPAAQATCAHGVKVPNCSDCSKGLCFGAQTQPEDPSNPDEPTWFGDEQREVVMNGVAPWLVKAMRTLTVERDEARAVIARALFGLGAEHDSLPLAVDAIKGELAVVRQDREQLRGQRDDWERQTELCAQEVNELVGKNDALEVSVRNLTETLARVEFAKGELWKRNVQLFEQRDEANRQVARMGEQLEAYSAARAAQVPQESR